MPLKLNWGIWNEVLCMKFKLEACKNFITSHLQSSQSSKHHKQDASAISCSHRHIRQKDGNIMHTA